MITNKPNWRNDLKKIYNFPWVAHPDKGKIKIFSLIRILKTWIWKKTVVRFVFKIQRSEFWKQKENNGVAKNYCNQNSPFYLNINGTLEDCIRSRSVHQPDNHPQRSSMGTLRAQSLHRNSPSSYSLLQSSSISRTNTGTHPFKDSNKWKFLGADQRNRIDRNNNQTSYWPSFKN